MRNKFYYDVVKDIKKRFPLDYPVHVRRVSTPDGISGDCCFDKKKKIYLIRINKKLAQFLAIETFVHEYGHAMIWKEEKEDHDETWGKAFSLIYRAFIENWC